MISTVTSKGQITIPVEVRRATGLATGSQVEFIVNNQTRIELVPLQTPLHTLRGRIAPRQAQRVKDSTETPAPTSAPTTAATGPDGSHAVDDPPQSRYVVSLPSPPDDHPR